MTDGLRLGSVSGGACPIRDRSAWTGSILVARRAGRYAARSATPSRSAPEPNSATGSAGLTSNSSDVSSLDAASGAEGPHHRADACDHQRLTEHRSAQPIGRSAEGHADPDLAGPLSNRRRHDAVEPDRAEQDGGDAESGQEERALAGLGERAGQKLIHRLGFPEKDVRRGLPDRPAHRRQDAAQVASCLHDENSLRSELQVWEVHGRRDLAEFPVRVSPATPTTVRRSAAPVSPGMRRPCPIGSCPGQNRRATDSLTSTTFAAPSRSASVKPRPRRIGTPRVVK